MPVIQVCVHDNADPLCDQTAFGASIPNPGCEPMLTPPDTTMQGGTEQSRYVEVRICYRFTTLFNLSNLQLPFGWGLSLGDIWLNKTRNFTVGWYPGIANARPSTAALAAAVSARADRHPVAIAEPDRHACDADLRAQPRRPRAKGRSPNFTAAPEHRKSQMHGAVHRHLDRRSTARSLHGTGTSATALAHATTQNPPITYNWTGNGPAIKGHNFTVGAHGYERGRILHQTGHRKVPRP